MQLPRGATVAVADGEKLNLFRNSGDELNPKLTAVPGTATENENRGSGARHHSSSANHDASQLEEDSFSVGVADLLNKQVLSGTITGLVIIAAPRTLGELRKHYHAKLSAVLISEISKDLTGHAVHDVEKAIAAA
jgi:protein required for attachment to host cells